MVTDYGTDEAATFSAVGSSAWAAGIAEGLFRDLPDRWAHTQEVAGHARWAAAGVDPEQRDHLVAAALLHDIGYAKPIAHTGFHPLDGARYLDSLGLFDLACLVAHHSGAAIEAGYRGLTDELAAFPRPTGPVADAVTYADVTSGPTGRAMQPGDRYAEIVDRHGEDSVVAAARAQARTEMYGAVARTLRRATAARPLLTALAVTPVELGCTTLLRFHGKLTADTADHAVHTLHTTLDGDSHVLVCDLALLTDLDPTGARRIARIISTATAPTRVRTAVTLVDPPAALRETLLAALPGSDRIITTGIEAALAPHCT